MKITFIQPYYKNIWEALGVGYIAAYINDQYKEAVDMQFFQGYFDSDEEIIIGSRDSDIVAISATSPAYAPGIWLAEQIKKVNKNAHIVFGGWHVTALKEKSLHPVIDQIVIGEGEDGFLQILNGNREKIVYSQLLPFKNLVWPERELIKNHRTVELCEQINGKRIASFQAHRGCPMNCVFCSESCMSGKYHKYRNPVRSRNIDDLIMELDYNIEILNLTYFKFVDATFDTDPQYVIDFCKEKMACGSSQTPWECLIHANFATEEMFHWLKEANCNQVDIGVESGSPKILKDIRKGLTKTHVTNTFKWAKKYGIKARGFYILGMPNETREDLMMTQDLADELAADVVGFTILCPYPGSDLYNHETMHSIKWEDTDEYSNDFWKTDHFTNQELKQWQNHFTKRYEDQLCERQKYE